MLHLSHERCPSQRSAMLHPGHMSALPISRAARSWRLRIASWASMRPSRLVSNACSATTTNVSLHSSDHDNRLQQICGCRPVTPQREL